MGTAVVAADDAAPILEFAKHVLDLMTLSVAEPVFRDQHNGLKALRPKLPPRQMTAPATLR